MNEYRVYVIIPTLNRKIQLRRVLKCLENQTFSPTCTIIVDSSEENDSSLKNDNSALEIIHLRTETKSASYQRNVALDYVFKKFKLNENDLISFLDDDLIIPDDYLEKQLFGIELGFAGFSGISVNPNFQSNLVTRILGFLLCLFQIKTKASGKVLKSGFANPVMHNSEYRFHRVEWLICCSIWKSKYLQEIRFDENLDGYSLGEDVIFSTYLSFKHSLPLGVDKRLKFLNDNHVLNLINREEYETKIEYMRKEVLKNMNTSTNNLRYKIATIGLNVLKNMNKIKNVFSK